MRTKMMKKRETTKFKKFQTKKNYSCFIFISSIIHHQLYTNTPSKVYIIVMSSNKSTGMIIDCVRAVFQQKM